MTASISMAATKMRLGKGKRSARVKAGRYRLRVTTDDGSVLILAERKAPAFQGVPSWMLRAKDAINCGQPEALAEVVRIKLGLAVEFNRKSLTTQEVLPI